MDLVITHAPTPPADPTAIIGRRIVGYLIDAVIALVLFVVVFAILAASDEQASAVEAEVLCDILNNTESGYFCVAADSTVILIEDGDLATVGLVVLVYFLATQLILPTLGGFSPGKALVGLRIVDKETFEKAGFGKQLVRWLLWFVDSFPWFFPLVGLITGLSSRGHRRVGDMAAGTLIIDNPTRRNAMTADMYASVPAAVAKILGHPDIRVMVVRGAGNKAFGAGSDISEFPTLRLGDKAASYDSTEHAAWHALSDVPMPVIAAIHGPCMGGGLAMALHCDIRIAADDASFGVPPARLGIAYPHGALVRLVELIGPAAAKLLLYSARVFGAAEALTMGLVQEVVPKVDLDTRVEELATEISQLAPLTHTATKLSVDSIHDKKKTSRAVDARAICYDSTDFREGIQAFLGKRRAVFQGR